MATALDRYGEALGFWTLPKETDDEEPLKLKLQMGDGLKLRDIMMDAAETKDKKTLFQRFADFMFDLIKRDYPQAQPNAIKGFIEMNIMTIFDDAQVTFRYTTREQLEQSKKEMLLGLKKSIGSS